MILYVFVSLLTLAVVGTAVAFGLISYLYPNKTTEIRCDDSVTGAHLRGDVRVLSDGGLDDDPLKNWSVGPDGTGKLLCTHNVWIDLEVTVPGYNPAKLRIDDASPSVLVVKLQSSGK